MYLELLDKKNKRKQKEKGQKKNMIMSKTVQKKKKIERMLDLHG